MKKAILLLIIIGNLCYGNIWAQEKLYPNEFNLGDVKLLDGPFKRARDLNIQTLLKYKVDRLLAPYLKEAGLTPKDSSYTNWAGLDGHIGGHYLTAMAINTATGNAECKKRLLYMIAELQKCQDANTRNHNSWGVGYVGGVPNSAAVWKSVLDGDFKAFHAGWVPWYNVHKMFAGLRDAYIYAGSKQAKNMFLHFCDWAIHITSGLTEDQMQKMLDTEQGGMNEVLADAYAISGDKKYLTAAKRFSHHQMLDLLSEGIDNLDNKHANTQVPKAIGFARIGELSGDKKFADAGSFFWQTVTSNRTLAFGGNSRREFFPSAASCIDFINDVEGPESCNSNNMLKLTEDLFRKNPSAKYADYYERTIYNHILSTQNPETGGYVYFTPARPRSYRVYSAPNEAMWCCVGTGMENHGKYNEFIYTHSGDSLFVNLFIPSQLNWKEKEIQLTQQTKFPFEEKTKLLITQANRPFNLMVRYPWWVKDGELKITVNGENVSFANHPSSYVSINRKWEKGDVIEITLPMHNTISHLPNVSQYIAIMHGPILLGAKTGTEDLKGLIADDSRWGHIPSGKKLPVNKAPIFVDDNVSSITHDLVPVKNEPLHFTVKNIKVINPIQIELQPFFQIYDARYMMYWMALSSEGYKKYIDSIAVSEKEKLDLEKRTVDFVHPGEQQPEVDHQMKSDKSRAGNNQDQMFREAFSGGYFSYEMNTNKEQNLSLMVRYWGAEWGSHKFDIYIDDKKLTTEDNTGKWNLSQFKEVSYAIPEEFIKGKEKVRIKFVAQDGSSAGPVYSVRLVKNK
ncbi:MAG: beta-L-arabinofuranosidase domain-containing protein [Flavisolibacter sp.]